MNAQQPSFVSRTISAFDGLKLNVRDYNLEAQRDIPVVCLAGLTRNSADFHALALALSQGQFGDRHRVLSLDYRGRGLSGYDRNWRNYDVRVETGDILNVLAALGVSRAVFVGTSRGGLNTMVIATARPGLLHAVVLNDVGPVLEAKGLARIRSYVGKLPAPKSWPDAIDLLKHVSSAHFTQLSDADWDTYARQTYTDKQGEFALQYDPNLMKGLALLDLEAPLPTLWPQFDALGKVPMLVLRGENSDLLSLVTYSQMLARHAGCQGQIVAAQGHAPMLLDQPTLSRIAEFINAATATA